MSDSISLMRRGVLAEVLRVYNAVRDPLPGGSSNSTYTAQGVIRAEVEPLRGNEDIQARQIIGSVTYRVRTDLKLPTGVSLKSTTRLVWESVSPHRTLEVQGAPRPSNARQQLVFLCTEREQ